MKGEALRVLLQGASLWAAALTAACALGPSHVGASTVMRGAEVPPAPTSPEREILLTKDLDRVPRLPHLGSLSVPGYPDAVLAEPFDAGDAPRPVVVVIHGLGDLPEPHCEAWRNITGARAFVVCPRGGYDPQFSTWGNPRYTHPCCEALRAHIDASLASLSARFGALADTRHPLLAGFSLGATEAALLAQSDTERFPRVAVLEGGLDVWFGATIRAFAARGGRRVLFGCGSAWCTPSARGAAGRIDGAGIGARVVFADVGHRPSPPLQAAIDDVFDWFVEGDSRWARD